MQKEIISKERFMIRKANIDDLDSIVKIYDEIHTAEEAGLLSTGWIRGIYPVRDTALSSIQEGELYVLLDEGGMIAASARFNYNQEECYKLANWQYKSDVVFVMHTLTVSPAFNNRGFAREFVKFYEELAINNNCYYLRMDTNAINMKARKMYARYGFKEAGTVPCSFNGIPNVNLVCLEKKLSKASE